MAAVAAFLGSLLCYESITVFLCTVLYKILIIRFWRFFFLCFFAFLQVGLDPVTQTDDMIDH